MRSEISRAVKEALGKKPDAEGGVPEMDRAQFEALLEAVYDAGAKVQEEADDYRDNYFRNLMQMLPDYVYFKDLQSRFVVINPAHARHLGLTSPEEAIGKTDFEFFREDFARAKYESEQEIIQTGVGFLFREEHQISTSGKEQWTLSTKLPLYDADGEICGIFGLSRDITDKKRAELELEHQKSLLETIVEILPCRVFVRDRDGRYLLINQEYRKWIEVDPGTEVVGKRIEDFLEDEKINPINEEDQEIMETGDPVMNQIQFDESPLQRGRWVLTSKVPLRNGHDRIEGLVGMTLDVTEQKEAEERAQVAQSALLLKNQQMEAELKVARQLQERILSEGFDEDHSLEKAGEHWLARAQYLYRPSHHLAGDFFFLLPLEEDRLGVIVCDVMGHGVKAALVTTLMRGLLLEIPGSLERPSVVLSILNKKLAGLAKNPEFPRFVTAIYSVLDLREGKLTVGNAGHPVPIWQRGAGLECQTELLPLRETGNALGLLAESRYSEMEFTLSKQTSLFYYTDGIVEVENAKGEIFGTRRLISGVRRLNCGDPALTTEAISQAVVFFAEGRDFDDDLCLVSIEVAPVNKR